MYLVRHAREVMSTDFVVLPDAMPLGVAATTLRRRGGCRYVVITHQDSAIGVASAAELHHAASDDQQSLRLGHLARSNFLVARADDLVGDTVRRMSRRERDVALVVDASLRIPSVSNIVGIIGYADLGACLVRHHHS